MAGEVTASFVVQAARLYCGMGDSKHHLQTTGHGSVDGLLAMLAASVFTDYVDFAIWQRREPVTVADHFDGIHADFPLAA